MVRTFFVGGAQPVDFACAEQRVRHALAIELALVRHQNPVTDRLAGFGVAGRHQLGITRRGDFELDIDAVGQRPRNAPAVTGDALRRTATAPGGRTTVAARTGLCTPFSVSSHTKGQ